MGVRSLARKPKASLPEGGGSRLRLTEGVVLLLFSMLCFPLQLCIHAALFFSSRRKEPKAARGR